MGTAQKILTAATQISAVDGVESLRVDLVAAQAGANKRMIYHYFGSRDGLIRALLGWQCHVLRSVSIFAEEFLGQTERLLGCVVYVDETATNLAPSPIQVQMACKIVLSQLCLVDDLAVELTAHMSREQWLIESTKLVEVSIFGAQGGSESLLSVRFATSLLGERARSSSQSRPRARKKPRIRVTAQSRVRTQSSDIAGTSSE